MEPKCSQTNNNNCCSSAESQYGLIPQDETGSVKTNGLREYMHRDICNNYVALSAGAQSAREWFKNSALLVVVRRDVASQHTSSICFVASHQGILQAHDVVTCMYISYILLRKFIHQVQGEHVLLRRIIIGLATTYQLLSSCVCVYISTRLLAIQRFKVGVCSANRYKCILDSAVISR